MFNHDDLKWIATTSTELNSILQQIARYSDLARRHKGEYNYIDLLGERVELASKTAQALFDRVTSQILAKTTAPGITPPPPPHSPFTVLPPPVHSVPSRGTSSARVAEKLAAVAAAVSPGAAPAPRQNSAASARQQKLPASSAIPQDIKVKNPKGPRELILLIEDEVEVAELAADMLADAGYKVIESHDGFEALKIYQRVGNHIGLVILDFFLPIMDGDAVFDELRALNPDINVVLSSGFAEQTKISTMLTQGLRGFIPKPYTCEKLLAQVRTTLDADSQVSA
jgi:CheY-like chemotaxis protein